MYTFLSPVEAKVLSAEKGCPLLTDAMKKGLFHPNCRHGLGTFYEGKSTIPQGFTDEQKARAMKNYVHEQEQRNLETQLRKWKRVEAGSITPTEQAVAHDMVKYYQKKLREHVKKNPQIRRNYWRERIEPMLGSSSNVISNEDLVKLPAETNGESVKTISGNQTHLIDSHAESKQLPYEDVTQEWIDAVDPNKVGRVIENDFFEVNGKRYDSSNATLDMDFGTLERETANWLKGAFHEDVQLVPRVAPRTKTFIKTPDFQFKGEYWDLKTIVGSSKETIINRVKKAEGQSSNFIIDVTSKSNLSEKND